MSPFFKPGNSNTNRLILFCALVLTDQISKDIIHTRFRNHPIEIYGGLLGIRVAENRGLALGLLSDLHPLSTVFFILGIILIFFLYRFYIKTCNPEHQPVFAYLLIMSSLLSNLLDDLFLGYGRDFILFFKLSVTNLADFYYCTGLIWMGFVLAKDERIRNYHRSWSGQMRDLRTFFRFCIRELRLFFNLNQTIK